MQKNLIKHGFTFIEILVGILIFSMTFIGLFYYVSYYNSIIIKTKLEINNEIILSQTYELFDYDPFNFKNNIDILYEGHWENNSFVIESNNIKFNVENHHYYILVKVFYNDLVIEEWYRELWK